MEHASPPQGRAASPRRNAASPPRPRAALPPRPMAASTRPKAASPPRLKAASPRHGRAALPPCPKAASPQQPKAASLSPKGASPSRGRAVSPRCPKGTSPPRPIGASPVGWADSPAGERGCSTAVERGCSTAYTQLIPAMPDKTQWPKGSGDKKKNGQHKCPICMNYGHHWHNCKKGNLDDIAAIKAIRGTPEKKKGKRVNSAQNSIMPLEEDVGPTSMTFPPSETLEVPTTKKRKRKHDDSTPESSQRSRSGSNQPDTLTIEAPSHIEKLVKGKPKHKVKPKKKNVIQQEVVTNPKVQQSSLSMCTRSKIGLPASPAMSTRSKRRLSL